MEGMNGSNCHPGLHIIAERGKEDQEQPKPLGAAGTESETDEGKTLSSSGGLLDLLAMWLHIKDGDNPSEGGFKGCDLQDGIGGAHRNFS